MSNDFVARDGCLPGDISQPRKGQAVYMLKKTEDQEDPEAPFQAPVAGCNKTVKQNKSKIICGASKKILII